MMETLEQMLERWDSGEGRPYKGSLIDRRAYEQDTENLGCMCAQGQVLHVVGGWTPQRLINTRQRDADTETANLLNISRAHAILLRNINDSVDGAPSIVLTDPSKVLGDKWSKLLDFWWLFHCYENDDWQKVIAARVTAMDAAGCAARDAAGCAAEIAAGVAARVAVRDAASDAAEIAAGVAARVAVRDAAGVAAEEIQGFELLGERGRGVFFLPMFGIQTLDEIPARPADYGNGVVPV